MGVDRVADAVQRVEAAIQVGAARQSHLVRVRDASRADRAYGEYVAGAIERTASIVAAAERILTPPIWLAGVKIVASWHAQAVGSGKQVGDLPGLYEALRVAAEALGLPTSAGAGEVAARIEGNPQVLAAFS